VPAPPSPTPTPPTPHDRLTVSGSELRNHPERSAPGADFPTGGASKARPSSGRPPCSTRCPFSAAAAPPGPCVAGRRRTADAARPPAPTRRTCPTSRSDSPYGDQLERRVGAAGGSYDGALEREVDNPSPYPAPIPS
jgi:hypothetical protein